MLVTDAGMATPVNELHPLKAREPLLVTDVRIVTLVNPPPPCPVKLGAAAARSSTTLLQAATSSRPRHGTQAMTAVHCTAMVR